MLFNSPLFLFIFLPLIFAIFLAAPRRWRNIALLVGSCGFYAWGEPRFIFVVFLSAVFDWLLGRQLAVTAGTARGRLLLGLGVLANAAVLVYYKYFNFLLENLNGLLSQFGAAPLGFAGVLLPIGVSFIVFEKITYLVDIYRKTGEPSESLFDYLTYVFLFPKLLAGPIVKYHEIAGQLKRHEVSWDNVYAGVSRFGLGQEKDKNVWTRRNYKISWNRINDLKDFLHQKGIDFSSEEISILLANYIDKREFNLTVDSISATTNSFSKLSGSDFERLLYRLYIAMGYAVQITGKTGDQGADLIVTMGQERLLIQAKCYKDWSVGNSAIQEAAAAKNHYDCNKAAVITTSFFTKEATELAKTNQVELIPKELLQKMLLDNLKESWS